MRYHESWSLLAGRATITLLFIAQDASAQHSWNSTTIRNSTTATRSSLNTISNNTSHTSPSTDTALLTSTGVILSTPADTSTLISTNIPGVNTTRINILPPRSTTPSGIHLSSSGTRTTPSGPLTPVLNPSAGTGNGTGSGHGNSSSTPGGVPVVPGGVIGAITSVIVGSGATVTKEIITGGSLTGPITLAPASTTYASSAATSAVSSVSSQLVAIVPIILAWAKDPIPLKTDALEEVTRTKDDVIGLIARLGSKPSSNPCGSKKKRFSLPIIGDLVNALSCILGGLEEVASKISSGAVGGVDDVVSTIDTKLDELEEKQEEDKEKEEKEKEDKTTDKTKPQSDRSTSKESSKRSESSCTSSQTAFQVTILCEPTVYTTRGTAVSTTTCPSTTTVTTTGCGATGSTTTISSSTSAAAAPTPCGADTCGDSCKLRPSSGDGTPVRTTAFDCKTFPTVTVADDDGAVATATATAGSSKREELGELGALGALGALLLPRELPYKEPETHDPDYVDAELADVARILPLAMGNVYTDGAFYRYPSADSGRRVYGLQALTGCTAVIIASNKGVYVAHIWEVGGFLVPNGGQTATRERTQSEFRTLAVIPLRQGDGDTESIQALIGTDRRPGPLHRSHQPKIFVITPFTTRFDRTNLEPPVTTNLRYEDRANYLVTKLREVVLGARAEIAGYTRNPGRAVEGMVFLEVDREQRWEARPRHSDRQIGMWRVWAGPDLIDTFEFRVTRRRHRATKRALEPGKRQAASSSADDADDDYEGDDGEEVDMDNPCPVGAAASGTGFGGSGAGFGGSGANSTSTATGNNNTAPPPQTRVSSRLTGATKIKTLPSRNHTATSSSSSPTGASLSQTHVSSHLTASTKIKPLPSRNHTATSSSSSSTPASLSQTRVSSHLTASTKIKPLPSRNHTATSSSSSTPASLSQTHVSSHLTRSTKIKTPTSSTTKTSCTITSTVFPASRNTVAGPGTYRYCECDSTIQADIYLATSATVTSTFCATGVVLPSGFTHIPSDEKGFAITSKLASLKTAPTAPAKPVSPQCSGIPSGQAKYVSQSQLSLDIVDFCDDAVKQGVHDKNSGTIYREYHAKTLSAVNIIAAWPVGSGIPFNKAQCTDSLTRILDDCDNDLTKNPEHWKGGGQLAANNALYIITPESWRQPLPNGPTANCDVRYKIAHDQFWIWGSGFEDSNYGLNLSTQLKGCGGTLMDWTFEYGLGSDGREWSATGRLILGQNKCIGHASGSAMGSATAGDKSPVHCSGNL